MRSLLCSIGDVSFSPKSASGLMFLRLLIGHFLKLVRPSCSESLSLLKKLRGNQKSCRHTPAGRRLTTLVRLNTILNSCCARSPCRFRMPCFSICNSGSLDVNSFLLVTFLAKLPGCQAQHNGRTSFDCQRNYSWLRNHIYCLTSATYCRVVYSTYIYKIFMFSSARDIAGRK